MSDILKKTINKRISRRTFLKASAAAGGVATVSGLLSAQTGLAASYGENTPDPLTGVKYRRSGCWGCAFGCGNQVRVKTVDGVDIATKIDGNPYDIAVNDFTAASGEVGPWDITKPHMNPGRLCAKGQGMLKDLYDPYRVLTPLKRAGARGENKWEAISWSTAIDEIVNGGTLPGHGATSYTFQGLKEIRGDGSALGAGHADIHPDFRTGIDAASVKIQSHSKGMRTLWIDGRNQQKEFGTGTAQLRFGNAMGIQRHYHDSICNGNWKAAWGKALGGYKHRPDYHAANPTYIIYAGSNPFEAEQALNHTARRLTDALAGGAKLIVLDPRCSVTASKANQWGGEWLRIKQSGDGAFALGVIKSWFATGKITSSDAHLKATKATAAKLHYSNAAYLVEDATGDYHYGKLSANVIDPGTGYPVAGSSVTLGDLDPASMPASGYQGTVYQLLRARVAGMAWSDIEAATGLTQAKTEEIAGDFWDALKPVAMPYRGVITGAQGYYAAQAFLLLNILRDRIGRPGGLVKCDVTYGFAGPATNGSTTTPTGDKSEMYAGTYYGQSNDVKNALVASQPRRAWWYAYKMPEAEILPRESIGYPWRVRANMFYVSNHLYNTQTAKHDAVQAFTKTDGDGYYVPLNISITTTMNETADMCDYILPDTTWGERWTDPVGSYGGPPVYRGTLRRPVVGSYVPVTITDGGSNSRSTYWYKGAFGDVATGTYNSVDELAAAISGPQTSEDILILLGKKMKEEVGGTAFASFGYDAIAGGQHLDSSYDHVAAQLNNASVVGGSGHPVTVATLKGIWDELNTNDGITIPAGWTTADAKYYMWMGGRRQALNNANLDNSVSGYMKNIQSGGGLTKAWIDYFQTKKLIAGSNVEYFDQLPPATKDTFSPGLDISKGVLSVDGTDLDVVDSTAGFTHTVSTNKMAWHCQSRTGSNEWLKELQPSNFVDIGEDGAGYALASDGVTQIVTGDTVILEANYLDANADPASQTGIARVTDTLRSGQIHIEHHFGRWATGSHTFKVGTSDSTNGLTGAATYDSQGNFAGGTRGANYDGKLDLGAGVAVNPLGRRDPFHEGKGGGGLNGIAGGHVFYATRVKVTRVS